MPIKSIRQQEDYDIASIAGAGVSLAVIFSKGELVGLYVARSVCMRSRIWQHLDAIAVSTVGIDNLFLSDRCRR